MIQTTSDIHETYRGAHILYCPDSRLLSMTEFGRSEPRRIAKPLKDLAAERGCTKLEVMVPASQSSGYVAEGFVREARVGGFYKGREDCLVMSHYLEPGRIMAQNNAIRDSIINLASAQVTRQSATDSAARLSSAAPDSMGPETDEAALREFYASLGTECPAPLSSPGAVFFSLRHHGSIRTACMIEVWPLHHAARIDYCATLPQDRLKGHATALVRAVQDYCHSRDIHTVFAVTPSGDPGMNVVLGRQHYRYGGTLVNHGIADSLYTDANIWYRNMGHS